MKKLIAFVIIVGALGTGGWAYYQNRSRPEPTVSTVPVSRGDVRGDFANEGEGVRASCSLGARFATNATREAAE